MDVRMTLSTVSMMLLVAVAGAGAGSGPQDTILLETDSFVIGVGGDGRVARFVDVGSGIDYCDHAAAGAFGSVRGGGRTFPATAAAYGEQLLTLEFAGIDGQAVFRVIPEPRRLVFEVIAFTCGNAEEFTFARIPLTLMGEFTEPFGASPLALNLETNCVQIPGLCPGISGFIATKRFGFVGARGAIVAGPTSELRDALKDAVKSSPDLAPSLLGGPWALDADINQGSYLIAMEEHVTEDNVGKWLDAARCVGASQIDLHGGDAFRFGDFEVNRDMYPRGRESLKAVVDAIHDAGFAAGLHTYAFFIAKETPWVTPVPDSRLDTDAVFTIVDDISEDDAMIGVEESTEAMSTVTGFQVRNSVTLRLDDELITYGGIGKEPPFTFKDCVRGAYGTRAARHARGTKAYHLKECFGLFVPQGDSSLFAEVAQRTADLYNACGFDMLYLDALDGADILGGAEYAWHYSAKFVYELTRRLEKPPVMEMSTFSHHLWCVRSRMQAWDCPARGVKDFVDCHALHNRQWKSAFLPTHLGWWGCFDWNGIQPDRTMPDDMEYLCAKALATDSSLSYIVGFSPDSLKRANRQRLAAIARRYEALRSAGAVPDSIKSRLAVPGNEFTLEVADDGQWAFRPASYSRHKITAETGAEQLVINNPYGPQPLRVRIEALLDAEDYDSPAGTVLADPRNPGEFGPAETQQGVTATLERLPENAAGEGIGAVLVARNTDVECDRAWAAFRKEFAPPAGMKERGLGLWVDGDGQGEVLNVQVRTPQHLGGGFADHYIRINFTGRRYFRLVEPESEELSRYEWAHTRRRNDLLRDVSRVTAYAYPMYHVWVDYNQIASLTIGVNNLPQGKSVKVGLGAVKAAPLRKVKLVNPTVTIGGSTVTFPVAFESGSYLEFLGPDHCRVYDSQGESVGEVVPAGPVPVVEPGENICVFGSAPQTEGGVRARIIVVTYGEPLSP